MSRSLTTTQETGNNPLMTTDNIQEKTLSIRISTDGFCFCEYNPSQIESLRLFSYTTDNKTSLAANLNNAISECPLIKKGERYTVKAIIETLEFTALPAEYDDRKDYKVYYRYCFPKSDSGNEIIANRLTASGFTIIFPVDKSVYNILQGLGDTTYYTPASIILGYMTRIPFSEDKYMLAYIQDNKLMTFSMKEGKPGLTNIFKSENEQDLVFYLLSIWKEQELSQSSDVLYLCGDKGVEELSLILKRFIRHTKRVNPNELFAPSLLNRTKELPFDLQALILCE